MYRYCHSVSDNQWRPNEFESGGGGHRSGAKRRKKIFFGRAPPLFGSKSIISSRFGEHFRDGQYSLVSFFFCCSSTHRAPPPCPAIFKVGGTCPLCPMESATLVTT